MYRYTVHVNSVSDKRDVVKFIEDEIRFLELDECLAEKRLSFTSDISVSKSKLDHLKRCCNVKTVNMKEL